MRVSLNHIKQYIDFELPPIDELVTKINQQLGKVEETIDFNTIYEGATIVRIVKCEKHPNADKLSVCEIDAGAGENIQVVCGAPNVRADMFAVWLPPESTVPSTFGDKEPLVLDARDLRGIVSSGMLASSKELALGDSHEGILEIDPNEWKPNDVIIKPGVSFAEAYGLNDTVIDIENKMFTHRPDLFGQLGVAREIAGIQNQAFKSPDWYTSSSIETSEVALEKLQLVVENDALELVPRFMVVAIKDVEVKPSPVWLQAELARLGSKSINNIVDVTNYIMLVTAQPTHAYDYDKLRGNKLGTLMANKNEKITLLNHKTYELSDSDIVIVDGEGPVGLAGIMGGGESEVSSDTKNIVLEVANFDMYAVRKSSMRHGIFTDALTRFNKGQSPLQNGVVLNLLIKSILDLAGGAVASEVFDEMSEGVQENKPAFINRAFINERLGLLLSKDEITKLLKNVEFDICLDCDDERHASDAIHYVAPYWRTDIELPEDIVEEVGRLYGFDKLPRELPKRSIKPVQINHLREQKQSIRRELTTAGANEVLTYSFIHEKLLKNSGQNPVHAYKLSNALSPDLQYYRVSLTPSLLDKVHMNQKSGHEQFALFEIGKTHFKGEMDRDESSVPNEDNHVGMVLAYSDKRQPSGAAYYHAKRYLGTVVDLEAFTITPLSSFDLSSDEWGAQLCAPYDSARSGVIVKDEKIWGVVGEFKPEIKRSFKLPNFTSGFEVHCDIISNQSGAYQPLSRYPSVSQDVTLSVSERTSYADVMKTVENVLKDQQGNLVISTQPLAIYQAPDTSSKTITFRLVVSSYESTLREADVTTIIDSIKREFNTN